MQFCCGGGVAECHSGERKEERERREIDQAWSIYGGSEEPMPEYNSGGRNEERETGIDQAWSIYGGSKGIERQEPGRRKERETGKRRKKQKCK